MIVYKIKLAGGSTELMTAVGAKRFADGYVGKLVTYRGKEHTIGKARFDSTRGFVLTDTHGKTFLYASIVDAVPGEEPSEAAPKSKKKGREAKTEQNREARAELNLADFRVRLERAVVREARELTRHDPDLHISDPLFVAYLARLGLRELRRRKSGQ